MTITLADIDSWDAGAIDQVFNAAGSRAEGAQTTADTVGDLLSFVQWNGEAAEAARQSAQRIKVALGEHAEQCRRIAAAAKTASAEVVDIKYRLSMIRADADQAFLRIDSRSGTLSGKTAVLTVSQLDHRRAVMPELAGRVKQLLVDAQAADRDLATAIETAEGATTDGPTGTPRPKLPNPPPGSVSRADVKQWWDGLTPQQQTDYLATSPAMLDRDGIPADIRDAANRIRLPHEIAVAQATLAAATSKQENFGSDYARTHGGSYPPYTPGDLDLACANAQSRLDDLLGIQNALYPKNPDGTPRTIDRSDRRSLMLLDTTSNRRHVFGAVGIGDVDHAAHVGVTVGGVATNAAGLPGMADEATNLRHTTREILTSAGDLDPNSVATIAWVGYEPPSSMGDLRVVDGDVLARAAAPHLNSFFHGLTATTENPHQEITAFGHSYGSLVTSLALQEGSPVKDVVFYGSPGLELGNVDGLHLAPGGHAYYEQAVGDPIAWVQRAPEIGAGLLPLILVPPLAPLGALGVIDLFSGQGDHDQFFGDTPNQISGITRLSTSSGTDPMLGEQRAAASGHSEYPRDDATGNHQKLRMSGYNLAAVLSGVAGATKTGN
ncbi:alpha/beta hydrolase [Mycobacterium sp.]|uniref:alpha/beta hydrolase n=1 Tax=Mycobacterium sp. TaxID=1785 RepID=UPI003D6A5E92